MYCAIRVCGIACVTANLDVISGFMEITALAWPSLLSNEFCDLYNWAFPMSQRGVFYPVKMLSWVNVV